MYSELILHCIYVYLLFTNQIPSEADMARLWLNTSRSPADIYAVGLQEIDTGYEVLILNESTNQSPWEIIVSSILKKMGSYVLLKTTRLSSMFLMIFVRESLSTHITETAVHTISTGIGGILANKGGVGEFQCFLRIVFPLFGNECEFGK